LEPFSFPTRLGIHTLGKDARPNIDIGVGNAGNTRGIVIPFFIYLISNSWIKLVDDLGLSYHTVNHLNKIIDKQLPGRPTFESNVLVLGNKRLEFYSRDVMECIRSLFGDPSFAQELAIVPERHYTSHERTCRVYNEMYTGEWWWSVQVCVLGIQTNSFTDQRAIRKASRSSGQVLRSFP